MAKQRIKTGDTVRVLAGKDKGKSGKVIQVFPRLNRVVVDGVNMSKRHLRSRRQEEKGQIVEFAMPIHISNVKLIEEDRPAKKTPARKAEEEKETPEAKEGKEEKAESKNV